MSNLNILEPCISRLFFCRINKKHAISYPQPLQLKEFAISGGFLCLFPSLSKDARQITRTESVNFSKVRSWVAHSNDAEKFS